MSASQTTSAVQPLTRVNKKTGNIYARPRPVEAEIEATLDLPLHDAFGLAASGHLRPQTLVYLLRRFRPNRPTPAHDALLVAFFSRLERAGRPLVSGLPENYRERAHEAVKDKVLGWLEDDRMDIFECSFKLGAERLYLTVLTSLRLRMSTELSREDLVGVDTGESGEEVADALAFRTGRSGTPLAQAKAELASVMARLTGEERLAVSYVHGLGLTHKEAAAAMGCSDRKVGYLIKGAREKALEKGWNA